MTNVFISYSTSTNDDHKEYIEKFTQFLYEKNIFCWIDRRSNKLGKRWAEQIKDGIEQAENFLFLISSNSMASPMCHLELRMAQAMKKHIIAVQIEEYDVEESKRKIFEKLDDDDEKNQGLLTEIWQEHGDVEIRNQVHQVVNNHHKFFLENQIKRIDDFPQFSNEDHHEIVQEIIIGKSYKKNHTKWYLRARSWEDSKREDFLCGAELQRARNWLEISIENGEEIADLSREFIQASRDEKERLERERLAKEQGLSRDRRNLSIGLAVFIIGFIVVFLVAVIMSSENNRIDQELKVAHSTSTWLATEATGYRDSAATHEVQVTESVNTQQTITANATSAAASFEHYLVDAVEAEASAELWAQAYQFISIPFVDKLYDVTEQLDEIVDEAVSPMEVGAFMVQSLEAAYNKEADNILMRSIDSLNTISVLEGHKDQVSSVAYSQDGTLMASVDRDRVIYVRDADSGDIICPPDSHDLTVTSITFSPDGLLVLAGAEGEIILWEHSECTIRSQNDQHPSTNVNSVDVSPDANYIVTAHDDGSLRVWNAANLTMLDHIINAHVGKVSGVAFNPNIAPDSDIVEFASVGIDGHLRIWHIDGGTVLEVSSEEQDFPIYSVIYHPSGQRIMIGGGEQGSTIASRVLRLEFSSVSDRTLGNPTQFTGPTDIVRTLTVSPNGRWLVSAGDDTYLWVWNTNEPDQASILEGNGEVIMSAIFSPNNNRRLLVGGGTVGSDVGYLSIIEFPAFHIFTHHGTILAEDNGEPIAQPVTVQGVAFNSQERVFVSATNDNFLRTWDAATGREDRTFRDEDPSRGSLSSLASSPDGQVLLEGRTDGTIRKWDMDNYTFTGPVGDGSGRTIDYLVFTEDSRHFLSASSSGLDVWDTETLERVFTCNAGAPQDPSIISCDEPSTSFDSVDMSRDGRHVLGVTKASHSSVVQIWNIETGALELERQFDVNIPSAVLKANSTEVILVSRSGDIILWNYEVNEIISRIGTQETFTRATVSPDGIWLATYSQNSQEIHLWNIADGLNSTPDRSLVGHIGFIRSIAFSQDGRHVLSGDSEGYMRWWPIYHTDLIDYACVRIHPEVVSADDIDIDFPCDL